MLQLEELMEQWKVDSTIDHSHLDTSSIRTANLHQKYLDLLTKYKIKIFALDKKYLEMKGLRSRYYNGQMTKQELSDNKWEQYLYKTPLKSELERLLETDPYLLEIKDKTSYFTFCFEYCEEVLKALRDRNYQIKAAIDFMKFQAGY
jgi:hypothetical protein